MLSYRAVGKEDIRNCGNPRNCVSHLIVTIAFPSQEKIVYSNSVHMQTVSIDVYLHERTYFSKNYQITE